MAPNLTVTIRFRGLGLALALVRLSKRIPLALHLLRLPIAWHRMDGPAKFGRGRWQRMPLYKWITAQQAGR